MMQSPTAIVDFDADPPEMSCFTLAIQFGGFNAHHHPNAFPFHHMHMPRHSLEQLQLSRLFIRRLLIRTLQF